MDITAESLKTAYPDIMSGIEKTAFQKGYAEGLAKGTNEGIKAGSDQERARIKAVEDATLPGHEDLITRMKFDGVTTGEQAAVKILQAEKSFRETKLDAFRNGGPVVVAATDPAATDPVKTEKIEDGQIQTEDQMKAIWNKDKALRMEYGGDFEAYKAYIEASTEGLVKIYGAKGGK